MGPIDGLRKYERVFTGRGGVISDTGSFMHKDGDVESGLKIAFAGCRIPDPGPRLDEGRVDEPGLDDVPRDGRTVDEARLDDVPRDERTVDEARLDDVPRDERTVDEARVGRRAPRRTDSWNEAALGRRAGTAEAGTRALGAGTAEAGTRAAGTGTAEAGTRAVSAGTAEVRRRAAEPKRTSGGAEGEKGLGGSICLRRYTTGCRPGARRRRRWCDAASNTGPGLWGR